MKKQHINREYNFPDSELYTQSMERLSYIKRDYKEFDSYAYTGSKIKQFEKWCKEFADLPTDHELVGTQMEMTSKKNAAREKLKTAIRSVMTRVASKYHRKSGHYRKFGTIKMNDMSDPQLLLCGRRVVRVSHKMISFLVETGLRPNHIDEVQKAAANFENSLHIQQDKISDRDIAVEIRTELGNQLYRELILVCDIGKDIWAESNKSKYENYCVYESNNDQKIAKKNKLKTKKS